MILLTLIRQFGFGREFIMRFFYVNQLLKLERRLSGGDAGERSAPFNTMFSKIKLRNYREIMERLFIYRACVMRLNERSHIFV